MANIDTEVKVSVEKVIHDTFKETIQLIADEYKIQVQDISVSWAYSTTGEAALAGIEVKTQSR